MENKISSVWAILTSFLGALDNKPKGKHDRLNITVPAELLDAEEIRIHLKRYFSPRGNRLSPGLGE
jgi:hypothetical protein